jgi:hypothetical protein
MMRGVANCARQAALAGFAFALASCHSTSPTLSPADQYAAEGPDVLVCIHKGYPVSAAFPDANAIIARRAGSSDPKIIDEYCKRATELARKSAVRRPYDSDVTVRVDGDERLCSKEGGEVICN